jgi:hypothetical protein
VGGGREKNPSSKLLDKHSTPIDRHYKQEVMTEASIRKVYRIRMDSLDVVSVTKVLKLHNIGEKMGV